jgi:hypothetical protein
MLFFLAALFTIRRTASLVARVGFLSRPMRCCETIIGLVMTNILKNALKWLGIP